MKAPTRRAAWKVRAAGSAATTASPCPRLTRSPSSMSCSPRRTPRTTTAGSRTGLAPWGRTTRSREPALQPLPAESFPTWLTLTPRVDRHARITVRTVQYSVPVRLIGQKTRVRLSASELVVMDGKTVVTRHERSTVKGGQVLILDHYLEVLVCKPGALPGATALTQARARGVFTPAHEAFWAAARKKVGDRDGTRELIEVLLLHRHLAHDQVVAGLIAAVSVGAISAEHRRRRSPPPR